VSGLGHCGTGRERGGATLGARTVFDRGGGGGKSAGRSVSGGKEDHDKNKRT